MTNCPIGYVCPSEASLMQLSTGGSKTDRLNNGSACLASGINAGKVCNICQITFHTATAYKQHASRAHKELIFPGGTASNIIFSSREDAVATKQLHLAYLCPVLTCKYSSAQKAKQHFFVSVASLRQHYARCHMERRFRCSYCDQLFATQRECSFHLQSCKLAPPSIKLRKANKQPRHRQPCHSIGGIVFSRQTNADSQDRGKVRSSLTFGNTSIGGQAGKTTTARSSTVFPNNAVSPASSSASSPSLNTGQTINKCVYRNVYNGHLDDNLGERQHGEPGFSMVPAGSTASFAKTSVSTSAKNGNIVTCIPSNGIAAIKKIFIQKVTHSSSSQASTTITTSLSRSHTTTTSTSMQPAVIKETHSLYKLVKESVDMKNIALHSSPTTGLRGSTNGCDPELEMGPNSQNGAAAHRPLKIVLTTSLSSSTSPPTALSSSSSSQSLISPLAPVLARSCVTKPTPNASVAKFIIANDATQFPISSKILHINAEPTVHTGSPQRQLQRTTSADGIPAHCYAANDNSTLADQKSCPLIVQPQVLVQMRPNRLLSSLNQAHTPTFPAPSAASDTNATELILSSSSDGHRNTKMVKLPESSATYIAEVPHHGGSIEKSTLEVLRKMNKVPTPKQLLLLQRSLAKSRKKQMQQQATRRQYQVELDNAKGVNSMLDTIISNYRPILPTEQPPPPPPKQQHRQGSPRKLYPKSTIAPKTRHTHRSNVLFSVPRTANSTGGAKHASPTKSAETDKFLQSLPQCYREMATAKKYSNLVSFATQTDGRVRHKSTKRALKRKMLKTNDLDPLNETIPYSEKEVDGGQSPPTIDDNVTTSIFSGLGATKASATNNGDNLTAINHVATSQMQHNYNSLYNWSGNATNLAPETAQICQAAFTNTNTQFYNSNMHQHSSDQQQQTMLPKMIDRGFSAEPVYYPNYDARGTNTQHVEYINQSINTTPHHSYSNYPLIDKPSQVNIASPPYADDRQPLYGSGAAAAAEFPSGGQGDMICQTSPPSFFDTGNYCSMTTQTLHTPPLSGSQFRDQPSQADCSSFGNQQRLRPPVLMEDAAVMVSDTGTQRYLGLVADNWTSTTDIYGDGAGGGEGVGAFDSIGNGLSAANAFSPQHNQMQHRAVPVSDMYHNAQSQQQDCHYANFGTNTAQLTFNDQCTNTGGGGGAGFAEYTTGFSGTLNCMNNNSHFSPKHDNFNSVKCEFGPTGDGTVSQQRHIEASETRSHGTSVGVSPTHLISIDNNVQQQQQQLTQQEQQHANDNNSNIRNNNTGDTSDDVLSELDHAAAQLAADIAHIETQTEYPFDLAAFLNDDADCPPSGPMGSGAAGDGGWGRTDGLSRGRAFEHLLNTAETQTTGSGGGFLECLMATAETQTLDATAVS